MNPDSTQACIGSFIRKSGRAGKAIDLDRAPQPHSTSRAAVHRWPWANFGVVKISQKCCSSVRRGVLRRHPVGYGVAKPDEGSWEIRRRLGAQHPQRKLFRGIQRHARVRPDPRARDLGIRRSRQHLVEPRATTRINFPSGLLTPARTAGEDWPECFVSTDELPAGGAYAVRSDTARQLPRRSRCDP